MKRPSLEKLPEFSEKNYVLAGKIFAAIITLSGIFLIYEIIFVGDLTFSANWNIFDSVLGNFCFFIGFILAIVYWGRFGHWSRTPYTEYRDSSGNLIKVEKNEDVIDYTFAAFVLPLLGHFVVEPIAYGCMIYYPIQIVIAILGTIFPFILVVCIVCIIVASWKFTERYHYQHRSAVLVMLGIGFTLAFAYGGYSIQHTEPGQTIQMLTSEPVSEKNNVNANTTSDLETAADAEEDDDELEDFGEEGLMGSLAIGTAEYEGHMDGAPIEFTITKKDKCGNFSGVYKNLKDGTTTELYGESLPAMAGDVSFYGNIDGAEWAFFLSGTADEINGTHS